MEPLTGIGQRFFHHKLTVGGALSRSNGTSQKESNWSKLMIVIQSGTAVYSFLNVLN